LTLIAGGLYLNQTVALPLLEFNRELIADGQYWRILTGNFLHTNGWHLLLNIAGLLLLSQLFGQYYTHIRIIAFSIINCCAVGVMLYFFTPDIYYYVGLSGFLHGLFVAGCLEEITRGIRFSYLLLLGVGVKIIHEQLVGAPAQMSELIGASVAVDAHLYGALTAVPMYVCYRLYVKFNGTGQI
jgi:rhomboid family GlyGly-CTERM serine protease